MNFHHTIVPTCVLILGIGCANGRANKLIDRLELSETTTYSHLVNLDADAKTRIKMKWAGMKAEPNADKRMELAIFVANSTREAMLRAHGNAREAEHNLQASEICLEQLVAMRKNVERIPGGQKNAMVRTALAENDSALKRTGDLIAEGRATLERVREKRKWIEAYRSEITAVAEEWTK